MHIQVKQLVYELSLPKYALFATYTLHFTKHSVGRNMEWSNFQHGRVDFVKFGSESVKIIRLRFLICFTF